MYLLNDKLKAIKPYEPLEGDHPVRLDANESFLPIPADMIEEAQRTLVQTDFNRYPDPRSKELCRAFSELYGINPENTAAGNGSDELISVIFSAFLQKGDAFATVEPDFSMYDFTGFLSEARHVKLGKREDMTLDTDKIIEVCAEEDIKLLIFSNPCNPTSVVCPKEEVRRLIKGVDALVVLDEAYMDFSDQSLLDEINDFDNLIILRTCSKAFGMAALRLGFAVAGSKLITAVRAAKSPYNVNVLSQRLGTLILKRADSLKTARDEILRSRDGLLVQLESILEEFPDSFRILPSATNFITLEMKNGDKLCSYLLDMGIAIRFTGGLVRITCGTESENRAVTDGVRAYFSTGQNVL